MKAKPAIRRRPLRVKSAVTDSTLRPELALAAIAAIGVVALARTLRFDAPTELDVKVWRVARSGAGPRIARAMRPLFPIGLPGGNLTMPYATARALNERHRRGGSAIVTSAWLGWLVHRAIKVFYFR